MNWRLASKTRYFTKTDSQAIEFRVTIPPDGEEVLTYTVRYTW